MVSGPTLTISPATLDLGTTTVGTAGAAKTYTISGSSLTSAITITAPTGVEISSDNGASYKTTVTLTPTAGTVASTTITVRIAGSAAQGAISAKVANTSTGATEQDVTVSGTVNAVTQQPTITISATTLDLGTTTAGTAGTAKTYTVSGSNLTAPISITAPTGTELSADAGATYKTTVTLTPTSGTVASTTITVRITSAAAQGAISGKVANTSTGATEQDVTVTGTVNTAGGARTPGTVFLEVGGNKSNTSTAAARSKIVKVFIDAGDLSAAANAGGVQSGTFYVKYDPTVLSINESSPGTAGSDIQLGDLLSSFPAGTYNVGTAAGFGPGIVGVGITHATTTFYTGTAGGHLVELDFHVLQTIPVGNTTLLDLVNSVSGKLTVLADTGGKKYALTPALTTYAGSLTQTGALTQVVGELRVIDKGLQGRPRRRRRSAARHSGPEGRSAGASAAGAK